MSTDILLNTSTHDVDISKGGRLLTENSAALGQRLKIAVLLREREWLPNLLEGVPYQQRFFNAKNNKEFIDSYMKNYISNIEGVVAITSYISQIKSRSLEIDVSVRTTKGTIENFLLEV